MIVTASLIVSVDVEACDILLGCDKFDNLSFLPCILALYNLTASRTCSSDKSLASSADGEAFLALGLDPCTGFGVLVADGPVKANCAGCAYICWAGQLIDVNGICICHGG